MNRPTSYPNPTRGAIVLLALTLGAIGGGLWVWLILGDRSITPTTGPGFVPASSSLAATSPQPIVVHAILELPSPTATNTPMATATGPPDPAHDRNFCTAASKSGDVCKVPLPTPTVPPTRTPYPACNGPTLKPGDWCVVPGATPTGE